MVDGKLSSIMFHWCPVNVPHAHVWDNGLIPIVTGEIEVPVKTLVVRMPTCSRITCSEKHMIRFTLLLYLLCKLN